MLSVWNLLPLVFLIFFPENKKNISTSSNSLPFGSFSWYFILEHRNGMQIEEQTLTILCSLNTRLSGPQGERRSNLYESWTPEGKTISHYAWAASKAAIGTLNSNRRGAQAISNYVASHSYNFVTNLLSYWIYCQYELIAFFVINQIISNG